MELQLGRLEQVQLRDVWLSESSHFTPWLARPENLSELGRELGIELDHEASEAPVGLFRADLLCRESRTGRYVLIENQIEQTDHTHLGQLLTYAAGLSTVTIVWVARTIREEHRAALDWLNEVTSEDIGFFGIEVELWRIGDSPPAPKFKVVSKPNAWTKQLVSERTAQSQNDQAYVEYWEAFKDYLKGVGSQLKPLAHGAAQWLNFAKFGRGIHLAALAGRRDKYLRVEFYVEVDPTNEKLTMIREAFDVSYANALPGLVWDFNDARRSNKAYLMITGVDPSDESKWTEQFEWLRTSLDKMNAIFPGIVTDLGL